MDDARKLTGFSLTAESTLLPLTMVQTTLSHLIADRSTTLTLGCSRSQGAIGLGANLGYSNRTGLSANLTLRLGIAREPRYGHLFPRAQGATTYGAVSAHAFLDTNGNGVRDPLEKPLPNLGFLINGSSQQVLSDSHGVSFLQGLPQGVDAHISINASTLDDPLMRPGQAGARITPRAGHVVRMEIPIVILGELNGTTYLRRNGIKAPLPGLRLELRNAAGQVVKSQRAAADGFFNFTELPPGDYQLEVPETAAKALAVPVPPPRSIHLAAEGSLLDGMDIIVDAPDAPALEQPTPSVPRPNPGPK